MGGNPAARRCVDSGVGRSISRLIRRTALSSRLRLLLLLCALGALMLGSLTWVPSGSRTDRFWCLFCTTASTNWLPWWGVRTAEGWRVYPPEHDQADALFKRFLSDDPAVAQVEYRPASIYIGLVVPVITLKQGVAPVRIIWSSLEKTVHPDDATTQEARQLLTAYALARYGDSSIGAMLHEGSDAGRRLGGGGRYALRSIPDGLPTNAVWVLSLALMVWLYCIRRRAWYVRHRLQRARIM